MHERDVADILITEGIRHVISLPCDRTKNLSAIFEQEFDYIPISREEDGIGICSGLSLSKTKSVLHMQSSGIGNSLNALLTLPALYHLPVVILASWRGQHSEKIIAQVPFNCKIPALLELYEIPYTIITSPEDIPKIRCAIQDAYLRWFPHVILLSPQIWEGDEQCFSPGYKERIQTRDSASLGSIHTAVMQRYDAIQVIRSHLTDELVISNIGFPSKELYAAGDRVEHFYMLGSYTQATPLGLGLALGTDKPVIILDGDGSLLGTAVLPTVALSSPENLVIIGLDNGVYGSTGGQCSPAHSGVDLEKYARACGIQNTIKIHTPDELTDALKLAGSGGPWFLHVIIKPGNAAVQDIPLMPDEIRARFQSGLL